VTLVEALFGLLGVVALGSGLLVVTTRQLVHAALWLVVCLGAIAGCYLLLSAELVAWVQVLIYVGAVVVLLLFGLMLTRAPIGVSADLDAPPMQRVAAAVVALGLAGLGRKPVLLGSQQIDRDGLVWPPESAVGIERWILVTVGAVGVTVEAIWIAAPLVRSWWLRISPRRDRGAAARASDADGAGES